MKKIFLILLVFTQTIFAQQTQKIFLSGSGNGDTKQWDFFCTNGANANKWTTIAVPSCWELQGFGKYDYGFAKDSVRGKEKGLYKTTFNAPLTWKNKNINIAFEGVMTDAEVKVNGKLAGAIHQGAYYTFKYDITKLLQLGKQNILEVAVAKHSANESVNNAERKADFWIFGGIFRPVYLEVLPEIHFKQVSIDANSNGELFSSIITTDGNKDFTVELNIKDVNNKLISKLNAPNVNDNAWNSFLVSTKLLNIKLWTSETPYLYTAEFTIYKNKKALHTVTQKFGFRTVEVKQRDGIYVNGVKMKFKGVNRAPFRPETGRTVTKQNSIDDVLLIKEMNMNAVRCSHYPPDAHFLDACDSLGLFVIDELAGWHGNYDDITGEKLVKEMIAQDAHHPSIILWANGNEGGHNFNLHKVIEDADYQKRKVIHPWQLHNGIETQHYREYNYGIGNYENGREIVMPTEFLHGQFDGGHGAGLEDYWEKMWHNPLSAGGFLWDFADQAVMRKDKNDSLDTDKHRAADGIVGPHHQKEASFYAIKEIWSPIYFEKKYITNDWDGKLNVENRFHFTNLNQCTFYYTLKNFTSKVEYKKSVAAPIIFPNSKGLLKLALPINWNEYDVVCVTANGMDGKEIYTWSFPIKTPISQIDGLALDEGYSKPTVTLIDSIFSINANGLLISINKNGLLQSVKNKNGFIPFSNGPYLQEVKQNFSTCTYKYENKNLIIESVYDKKNSFNVIKWTIYPTGLIKMDIKYFPEAYFTNMVGANFSLPETEMESIDYIGNGPYRVWKNRLKGNQFGIWHKDYNNTETGEYPWVYPEFKGYYSNMYSCTFNLKNHKSFTVFTENEDLFLRLYTPNWKTDQWHNYEPIFPSGDISFMQGIPSIGSKTQRNETTGPMGQKNIFYDYEKEPNRALQMVLYFRF